VELLWRITAQANGEYHFFNHILDASGKQWGQKDGVSLAPRDWRPGGPILSTFSISLAADAPPGSYWLRTGMYRYPEIQNVSVLDVAGNPAGDTLLLGPFDVTGGNP